MSELTLKELLDQGDQSGDVSGVLFLALLKIEMESAEFAVDYIMNQFVESRKNISTAPDNMVDDLSQALNVYAAFTTLLEYYSPLGSTE